jgi:ParB family chromosome partitioning protein
MNAEIPKRKNLGRGLNALFGEQDDAAPAAPIAAPTAAASPAPSSDPLPPTASPGVTKLPLDLLTPSKFQPRHRFDEEALDELARSIAEKGVLQPLLVRPNPNMPGTYEIVAGERRWRAAQRANVHEVPVNLTDLSDSETLEVALIENLQRQDLSPVEEALSYKRLMDEFGHTAERLAEVMGKSRPHVSNLLRLLALPESVLTMLDNGQLTMGQARPLIGLTHAETLAKQIVKKGLSAREAERLAKGYGKHKAVQRLMKDADTVALEQSLEKATGYKVNVSFNGKGGVVSIGYANLEQLDDIVRRLSSGKPRQADLPAGDELDSDESFSLDDAVSPTTH